MKIMPSEGNLLKQIETLLDQLILNAERLKESSLKVISEEELNSLQAQQSELIQQLQVLDEQFHREFSQVKQEVYAKHRASIDKRIEHFQKLNEEFIQNLSSNHGIIDFNLPKINRSKLNPPKQ